MHPKKLRDAVQKAVWKASNSVDVALTVATIVLIVSALSSIISS